MNQMPKVPEDYVFVRVTPEFDEQTIPKALLAAHKTAAGIWGNLVVLEGQAGFYFEDEPEVVFHLTADDKLGIPPERLHRVVLDGPVRLYVEFYRDPADESPSDDL
jgi:tellurite methyltransferase